MRINNDAIRNAINKWEETAPIEELLDIESYRKHFLNTWGIKIGPFNTDYKIVDEQKYMLFLLSCS